MYEKYKPYEEQLEKLHDSSRHIRLDSPELSLLEKKAVMIVHCCDFDVREITYKGIKGYILWDCQLALYRGEDRCKNIDEFLAEYSVTRLQDVTLLLSDAYGFDRAKVFDDSVLYCDDCYDEEAI